MDKWQKMSFGVLPMIDPDITPEVRHTVLVVGDGEVVVEKQSFALLQRRRISEFKKALCILGYG